MDNMEKKLAESQEICNTVKSVYQSVKFDYEYDSQRLADYKAQESPDDEMIHRLSTRKETYEKIFKFLTGMLEGK